jgi:hypothetical protein
MPVIAFLLNHADALAIMRHGFLKDKAPMCGQRHGAHEGEILLR